MPDGEEGELVLTTLCKRAMPMIRYRTRDITALEPTRCVCGRTLRRIRRIGRRSDDMLIIRGVNLFPSQIEAALLKVEGTMPHYQIIVDRQKDLDTLEVQVEVTADAFSDTVSGHGTDEKTAGPFHRNHHRLASRREAGGPAHPATQRRQGETRH